MKIIVVGGTGLIGSGLVKKLRCHGHDARAASPDSGVDTLAGEGLDEALKRRGPQSDSSTAVGAPFATREAVHDIHVSVTSPEAAEDGIAEFWAGGELIGFTLLEDSDLMMRIESRRDGAAVVVGAHSPAEALGRASLLRTEPDGPAAAADRRHLPLRTVGGGRYRSSGPRVRTGAAGDSPGASARGERRDRRAVGRSTRGSGLPPNALGAGRRAGSQPAAFSIAVRRASLGRRRSLVKEVAVSALDVHHHLLALKAERALAAVEGLDRVGAYMADLDDEIAALRRAYVGAAVTEIATLWAELSAPQVG